LQIRVIEFTVGSVTGQGAGTDAGYIAAEVQTKAGDAIDAVQLGDDLAWLNRYPFRQISAVFAPGKTLGVTDLTLGTEEIKPWQVYGGYSNSGSPATSLDRYFVGATVGGLLGQDSVLSYQATGSHDALDKGLVFAGASHSRYQGQALSLTLPAAHNGVIEANLDWVATNQENSPFQVEQTTLEASLGYRFALSDLHVGRGGSDARFGFEAKRQEGKTLFGGVSAYDVSVDVYQFYVGYHRSDDDAISRTNLDLAAHFSPGDWNRGNSAEQAQLDSQGRELDARYAYLTVNYDLVMQLSSAFSWKTQLNAQFATRALPNTEQAGLGGNSLVRGYTLDDGAFDRTFVLRNGFYAPSLIKGPWASDATPYAFFDAGYGKDRATGATPIIRSTGFGAEMQLSRHANLNLDAAYALKDGYVTKDGDWKLEARITASF
jgi:hemolysin activation/secretion protein